MKPAQGEARHERSPGLLRQRRQALKGRNNHPISIPEFHKKSLTQETSHFFRQILFSFHTLSFLTPEGQALSLSKGFISVNGRAHSSHDNFPHYPIYQYTLTKLKVN
jgi:hypothetical protein